MIPKIIHYVWLGGGAKTPSVKRCIASWHKVMPNYEIKEWNESNFDINSVLWVKEAIQKKNGHWLLIIFVIMPFIQKVVFTWTQM